MTPALSLPNVTLPDTGGLADPGQAIDNAYKAAFVYTRIVQVGKAPFSGANNYDWLLNHDLPGILANRFELGDFTDAQNLLLSARISEEPDFNEVGANWYWDGAVADPGRLGRLPARATNDTAFVRPVLPRRRDRAEPVGPEPVHDDAHLLPVAARLRRTGYLQRRATTTRAAPGCSTTRRRSPGLAAYRYIATRIGNPAEAQWADGAYTSLLNATNAGLAANEQASGFDFLPCEVNQPVTADRCNTPGDANWAGSDLWGQNAWDVFLQGGTLNGILGDPAQTDNLYQMGFSRLAGSVPYPSFGAYTGYSVALNTAYAAARALRQRVPRPADHQLRVADRHHHRRPERLVGGERQPARPGQPVGGQPRRAAVRRDPVRVADGRPDPDAAAVAGRPGPGRHGEPGRLVRLPHRALHRAGRAGRLGGARASTSR